MKFSKTEKHESVLYPGVSFTVRRLNEIGRARRDEKLLSARMKMSELDVEAKKYPNPNMLAAEIRLKATAEERDLTAEETAKMEALASSEDSLKWAELDAKADALFYSEILPVYIQTGLVSIEGLETDDGPVTKDNLFEEAPDGLLREIYDACKQASELSAEQLKNSLPPSTSQVVEQPSGLVTIAPAAAQ